MTVGSICNDCDVTDGAIIQGKCVGSGWISLGEGCEFGGFEKGFKFGAMFVKKGPEPGMSLFVVSWALWVLKDGLGRGWNMVINGQSYRLFANSDNLCP